MDNLNFIKDYLANSLGVKQKLASDDGLLNKIKFIAELMEKAYRDGKKILLAGNGGSAGDAQHIAAELVSRFSYDRPGLPAIALTTDTSMLTAIGNDYGFDKIFSRQIEAQSSEGDIFIGISTSGNSKNIIEAMKTAKLNGVTTIALCGTEGKIKSIADFSIEIPSDYTPFIQECHICVGHIICGMIEKNIFPKT